jgi:DNA-directed RNA polymerase subunit RPC12/RpoP
MVVYICKNCKKEFNKKSNYLNHIENKKKPCEQIKLKMHQNAPKCTKMHRGKPYF